MANSTFAALAEHPEYQKIIQKLMGTSPAIKALVNFGEADEAFMADMLSKELVLRKAGEAKKQGDTKIALKQEELDLDKSLGVGLRNSYFNLKTNTVQDALDLQRNNFIMENALGAANLGVNAWRANNNMKSGNAIDALYLAKLKRDNGLM